jgi:hypothetical protein
MRSAARWLVLGALGVLSTTGCGDPVGIDDVIGTWDTVSVNGYSVPGLVVVQDREFEVQYIQWTFENGGACTVVAQIDGEVDAFDGCSYTVDLEQATIDIDLDDEFTEVRGSIDGDRMTLTNQSTDATYVLRRR